MKRMYVVLASLALLAGCSRAPLGMWKVMNAGANSAFTVDQFIAVALEYQGPRAIAGIDTYGPTAKEFACERAAEAAVSQSGDMLPPGHTLVTTCLHIAFGGPLPKGAAVSVPITGKPFEYVTIGVEYTRVGEFLGAQAMHSSPDLATCMREARDVIRSNYADEHVAAGDSLLLYCTPVPTLEQDPKNEGGVV
jgi:hypothetical protein